MLLLLAGVTQVPGASSVGAELAQYLGPFAVVAVIGGGVIRYLVKDKAEQEQAMREMRAEHARIVAEKDQQIRDQSQAMLDFNREWVPIVTTLTSQLTEMRRDIERMERS